MVPTLPEHSGKHVALLARLRQGSGKFCLEKAETFIFDTFVEAHLGAFFVMAADGITYLPDNAFSATKATHHPRSPGGVNLFQQALDVIRAGSLSGLAAFAHQDCKDIHIVTSCLYRVVGNPPNAIPCHV